MNEYGIYSTASLAEPFSSLSHLLGALFFAAMTIPLMRRAASREPASVPRKPRLVTVGIFTGSTIVLLVVSGVYHALPFNSSIRETLLRLDYAAIFLMIAGTFTPIYTILFHGPHRWGWLTLIWIAAVAGILVKTCIPDWLPPGSDTVAYLAMGWVGVFGAITAWRWYGPSLAEPLLLGGAAYTAGASFMLASRPDIISGVVGPHELFHLAVLIGLACHWAFIFQRADGQLPDRLRKARCKARENVHATADSPPLDESGDTPTRGIAGSGISCVPTLDTSEHAG